jgi:hypothetical protein
LHSLQAIQVRKNRHREKSLKALDHLVLSSVVGPSPAPTRTSSQSTSAAAYGLSAYRIVTMSLHMRMTSIYFSGGMTTN